MPAVDRVQASAKGYKEEIRPFVAPPADGSPIPFPLSRGAIVSGRVLWEGRPLGEMRVTVHGRAAGRTGGAPWPLGFSVTAPDGTFSALAHAATDSTLSVRGRRHSTHAGIGVAVPIGELVAGQDLHLGDIECIRDGSVRGRVLVPNDVSPEGLRIRLLPLGAMDGGGRVSSISSTDAEGRFTMELVPPGRYKLLQDGRRGFVAATTGLPVEVRPSLETEVTVDTIVDAKIPMTLTFKVDGAPAVLGSMGMFRATTEEGGVSPWERLGPTDKAGRAGGSVPPRSQIRPGIVLRSGVFHEIPGHELLSIPGRTLNQVVAFDTARLRCVFPSDIAIPAEAMIRICLATPDARGKQTVIRVQVKEGEIQRVLARFGTVSGQALELRGFAPGKTSLRVELFEGLAAVIAPGTSPLCALDGTVTFVRGETSVLGGAR